MRNRFKDFENVLTKDFLLREYVGNKKSIRCIASEISCGATTVKTYLAKHSITSRRQWDHPNSVTSNLDPQDILDGYLSFGKTMEQLASEFGCSSWYISDFLRKNGVYTKKDVRDYNGPSFSEHELREMYCEDKKTISEIADIVRVSKSTVRLSLKKFGISIRNGLESQFRYINNADDHRYRDKDWLYKKYVAEHKNTAEIASMCSVGKTTIGRWLRRYDIIRRTNSEARLGHIRSEESRRKQAAAISGPRNHFYGRKHSDETKDFIRIQNSGNNASRYGRPPEWSWCEYTDIGGVVHKFQSSWERKYAEFLDRNRIQWSSHKGMRRFEYIDERGNQRTYGPDFYLPETDEYIEIKGWFTKSAKYKMKKVMANYQSVKFVILEESDLLRIGAL